MMQPDSFPVQNQKLFQHSGHPETPTEYLQQQNEIKPRYSIKN